MATHEIPRADWGAFFDNLSRRREGELVTVEILEGPAVERVLGRDLPLVGISADLKDRENTIAVMLIDSPEGEHVAHLIPAPTRVTVERVDDGEVAAVRIDSADEPPTRVRFPYASQGEVAGHESERRRASGPPEGGRGAAGYAESGRGGIERQRWEVRFGSAVNGPDGPVGKVKQVVVSPRTREVTHLVVERGFLPRQDVLVPAEAIESAGEEGVRLWIGAAELDAGPGSRHQPTVAPSGPLKLLRRLLPVPERSGERPAGEADELGSTIAEETPVECRDGPVGEVALVLLDSATLRATHIVVRRSGLLGRHQIVPLDWAREIGPERIVLDVGREQLDRLPEYRPDSVIRSEVEAALFDEAPLRWVDLATIRVEVRDGVVTLRGHVMSREHRARAEAAARRVHGVLAVRNELVADEDLEVAVGEALGRDPRTRGERIQVEAFQGVVHLRGEVSSGRVLAAAEEVAAGVPEVRAVVNSLVAPDATPQPARVLMPPVGVPIYATDGRVGRVDAVVISPRSRRVTGLVVSAEFPPDSEATPDTPIIRRRVVVPVEMVERSTPGGVDLNVDAATVANLPEYREEDYVVPDPEWQPPFDYRREYVRFALDAAGARRPELAAAPGGVVAAEQERRDDGRRLLPIRRGQRVVFRDREVGVVDHVLVDPDTHQVTHFVVRVGPHAPKDTIVPVDWVARVAEESVVVEAGPEQLDALPARAPERAGAPAAA